MSDHRFAIRTVRDGRVKVDGKVYRVNENHQKYRGELDGLRYAFGRYADPFHFVCLWGTEAAYRDHEIDPLKGPHIQDDGTIPWLFWDEEDTP
jgi:hypothetical protein